MSAVAQLVSLRPLTPEDLAARQGALQAARVERSTADILFGDATEPLKKVRAIHHAIARLLGGGMTAGQAAATVGWAPQRVRDLMLSPAFTELVAVYADQRELVVHDFEAKMRLVAADALSMVHERLMGVQGEQMGTNELVEIVKTLADRTGYNPNKPLAPVTNVNFDRAEIAALQLNNSQSESVEVVRNVRRLPA